MMQPISSIRLAHHLQNIVMQMPSKFWWLMAGVTGILLVSSLIGWILSRRGSSSVIDNLNARIRAWWAMAIMLIACFMLGKVATLVLYAFLSFFALREFITLTPTRRGDHLILCLCFYVAIPLQYWLIGIEWYGLFVMCIPVYGFLLLPAISALMGDTENFLERNTKIQWGVMLTVFCLSHAPALMLLRIPGYEYQSLLLLYLLLVVQLSDVLQLCVRQTVWPPPSRPQGKPVQDSRGIDRWWPSCDLDRRGIVVDYTFHHHPIGTVVVTDRSVRFPWRTRAFSRQA